MIPTYAAMLTPAQIDEVHESALAILERVGVRVENARARALFTRHGCGLDTASGIVTFPRPVIERCIAAFPGGFTYYGREPHYDRTVPGHGTLFATASAAPDVIDLETGEERRARSQDIVRLAKIVQQLPGFELFNVSITADDAPLGQFAISRVYPALKHCLKPTLVSAPLPDEFPAMLRLCELVAGGAAAYRERPFLTLLYSSMISPLVLEDETTESLMDAAEHHLPHYNVSAPIAGLTAPFTLLGTLVLTTAEFLVTAALAQMVREGTPVAFCALPIVADMRLASYASGGVENGMLLMACAQMARHYHVPSVGLAGATNAKLNDVQASVETSVSILSAMLAGIDVLHMGGLLDALMTLDFAKVLTDHETVSMLKHIWRGFESDGDALAVETIAEVGPGGAFIETEHTMRRLRTTAFIPQIADRLRRDEWQATGSQDAQTRALRLARELLRGEQPSLLSPEIDAQIRANFAGIVSGEAPPST